MGNIDDDIKPRERKQGQEYLEAQYLAKIEAIPPISDEEARWLLTGWRDFQDIKAKNRVIEGSLHLVLPIAKATTKRFGFKGNKFMTVWFELIGAGSLGLCQAAEGFKPDSSTPFENYARRCIRNECIHAAKSLMSVVDRPYYTPSPMDILLDPALPDAVSPQDYCGTRARPTTGSDRQDKPLGSIHARQHPWPKGWEVKFKEEQQSLGAKIYDLRKAGLTLKETADELGMSTTTVWRRQQAYMESLFYNG